VILGRSGPLKTAAAILTVSLTVGVCGAAADSGASRSTAPRHHVVIAFFGDSLSLTLGIALAAPKLESKYDYLLLNGAILGCGVADGALVKLQGKVGITASACSGTPPTPGSPLSLQPWPTQWQHLLSTDHPNVGVLLAGRWEVVNRTYHGKWTNILNPVYAGYVKRQLELASHLVTASGARMVFLTAPCIEGMAQPDGGPWPEDSLTRLHEYNRLVKEIAAQYPKTDSVIDLNSLVCPDDRFSSDYKGVVVRQSDGVHFSIGAGSVLEKPLMTNILASGRSQIARLIKHKTRKSK
jgi:hypothetical protein